MKLTGKNLQLVRLGLTYAVAEAHNMIATCPDVFLYAADIAKHEAEKEQFTRLLAKVEHALTVEGIIPK